ncbi:MAG: hypothetical protein JWN46_459 [Acidimicrobiales bacterium]|nr:hypothetical protein [Acidimicrobiales bacterium]
MDYERFVDLVRRQGPGTTDAAERAVRATLLTLGERISPTEARDLAAELPEEAAPWVFSDHAVESFDVDELVRRIAERAGTDLPTAERDARIVFGVLRRALSAQEVDDLRALLPADIRVLFDGIHVRSLDEILRTLTARTGLDRNAARRAIDAFLETLAERLPAGEVDDLSNRLPLELHPPLERGRAPVNGRAPHLPVEAFVARVAAREGVTANDAVAHARAALAALREAVGEELFDVAAELPPDYKRALLPVPR